MQDLFSAHFWISLKVLETIDPYGSKTDETKKMDIGLEVNPFVILFSFYSLVDGRQCAEKPSVNPTFCLKHDVFEMTKTEQHISVGMASESDMK